MRYKIQADMPLWHEAGHAVVARAMGINVEMTSVVPTDEGLGNVPIAVPKGYMGYLANCAALVICMLAGWASAALLIERTIGKTFDADGILGMAANAKSPDSDIPEATLILKKHLHVLPAESRVQLIKSMELAHQVTGILAQNTIVIVEELEKQGTLSGNTLDQLLAESDDWSKNLSQVRKLLQVVIEDTPARPEL